MIDSYKILKLLPNLDCGLCNNPSCITLARRISRRVSDVTDCPIVKKDNQNRIIQILKSKPSPDASIEKNSNEYYDEEIVEIQPCAEYGKVTLEAHLPRPSDSVFDLFDSCEMCQSFSSINYLENIKCSLEMGYGLAESEERRIHVFKTGKIMIRRAKDRSDAMKTLKLVSYSLGPSVICSCGNTLADCLGGGCDKCCIHLGGGMRWLFNSYDYEEVPAEKLLKPILEHFESRTTEDFDSRNGIQLLASAWDSMKELIERFKQLDELIKNNRLDEIEEHREDLYEKLKEITRFSNEYLISNLEGKPKSEALVFIGICRNYRRIIDAYINLKEMETSNEQLELYNRAGSFIFDSFDAFSKCDLQQAKSVDEASTKFLQDLKSILKENNYPMDLINLYKLTVNSNYISKILTTPVAV